MKTPNRRKLWPEIVLYPLSYSRCPETPTGRIRTCDRDGIRTGSRFVNHCDEGLVQTVLLSYHQSIAAGDGSRTRGLILRRALTMESVPAVAVVSLQSDKDPDGPSQVFLQRPEKWQPNEWMAQIYLAIVVVIRTGSPVARALGGEARRVTVIPDPSGRKQEPSSGGRFAANTGSPADFVLEADFR